MDERTLFILLLEQIRNQVPNMKWRLKCEWECYYIQGYCEPGAAIHCEIFPINETIQINIYEWWLRMPRTNATKKTIVHLADPTCIHQLLNAIQVLKDQT
jgi:hypothetical protein